MSVLRRGGAPSHGSGHESRGGEHRPARYLRASNHHASFPIERIVPFHGSYLRSGKRACAAMPDLCLILQAGDFHRPGAQSAPGRGRLAMETLKQAVRAYAARHANADGLAFTPITGLRMMCVTVPRGDLHSIYRPLVCLGLRGPQRMTVGREERIFSAGQSAIVSADMPVVGRIVRASAEEPYLAIAIELEMTILRDLAGQLGGVTTSRAAEVQTLFSSDTEAAMIDCA